MSEQFSFDEFKKQLYNTLKDPPYSGVNPNKSEHCTAYLTKKENVVLKVIVDKLGMSRSEFTRCCLIATLYYIETLIALDETEP